MPEDYIFQQQKEAKRAAKQRRTARRRGTNIAGAAIFGTLAAGALSSPKVREGVKKTAKKVGKKVKNAVKNIGGGKGNYVSDPKTGKMKKERTPKVKSNFSRKTKKAIKKSK